MEDDLFQFWCGNMVKLAAMIVCIGYLALGMDLDSSFVIFTIHCFQKYLIELCYTLPNVLVALALEYQVVCLKLNLFLSFLFVV